MNAALQNRLTQLGDYTAELRRWLDQPPDGDWGPALQRVLERMVQVVVGCAADAGDLWLEEHSLPVGESVAGVFQNLRDAGALDDAGSARFRRYTSARNRIVHDYDQVVPTQLRRDAAGLANDAAELCRRLQAS